MPGGEPFPGASPEETVNRSSARSARSITLFNSISKVRGGQAERMQPGMVISVNNPVGGTGPIPPGRFDIFLATTSASSLATLPFSAGGLGDAPDVDGLAGGGGRRPR